MFAFLVEIVLRFFSTSINLQAGVPACDEGILLKAMRNHRYGEDSVILRELVPGARGRVAMKRALGPRELLICSQVSLCRGLLTELQDRFWDLLELLVGEDGAVFTDIVSTNVAAAALADAACHLPLK